MTYLRINLKTISVNLGPDLLMRPEHSETKAKTETRECETEIETNKLL